MKNAIIINSTCLVGNLVVLFDRQHQFKHLVKMYAVVILLAVASFFFSVCIEFMHANAAKIKLWLEENNIQIAHLALTFLESSFKEKVIKLKFTIFFRLLLVL